MFFYNLKVAYRNLIRQKSISMVNIIGLALGLTCTILLFLMVHFSYTTDSFQPNYNRIFLVQQKISMSSGEFTADRVGGGTGPALAESFPNIESYTRFGKLGEMLLAYYPEGKEGNTLPISFIEEEGAAVDSTFFNIFSFDFLYGGIPEGTDQSSFIYLTEELSKKYFKETNPVGKTIYFQEGLELVVAGVYKELPKNTTIKFNYLVPFRVEGLFGMPMDGFAGTMYHTYLLLDDPASASRINPEIDTFLDTKLDGSIEVDHFITHIREAFLYGENKASWGIILFSIIGLGILLIAVINYINLCTAKSMDRAREVGIRKTGGAERWQLIRQFMSESMLTTFISVICAVLLTELFLPYFNGLLNSYLVIPYKSQAFWMFIGGLILIVGFFAGFYPSLVLSSFNPSLILKNFQGGKSRGATLRKILVVSQFTVTLFFIVCTIFLYKQMSYVHTGDLGINKENIIYIPTRGKLWNKYEDLKNDLLQESSVLNVSSGSELPVYVSHGDFNWGKESEQQNVLARVLWCDDDLTKTFNMKMASGSFYNKDSKSDIEDGIVVNEEVVKLLNYEGDPVGQRFRLWDQEKTIIGVVKNFAFFPIEIGSEAIILPYRNINQFIFLKTSDGFDETSLARLKNIIKKHNPDYPFEYFALSDYRNPTTKSSEQLMPILFYFSSFGIFISCLGLFGLVLFTVEKRTKEIGIRKVLGATTPRITFLLSSEFIKLVLIAVVIAIPLSYLALHKILSFFVLKINLSPVIFISTGIAILLLAMATILWHSIKVARRNPANSLRYE